MFVIIKHKAFLDSILDMQIDVFINSIRIIINGYSVEIWNETFLR
jgi:hypothetical protein